jgi:large subunit ribosomal protein L31
MKPGIHPENYREVLFEDAATGETFITRSTVATQKTKAGADGREYPHVSLAISSYSHPFFTGSERLVDTEGRVDKFLKKYSKVQQQAPAKKKK